MTVAPATGLPDILPTHTCFDDALDFFVDMDDMLVRPLTDVHEQFRVVHGICRGHACGTMYAHAWVEDANNARDPLVWQAGTRRTDGERVWFAMHAENFHELYAVQRCTRYSLALAAELSRVHGTHGPWRAEYVALCGDGGRVVGMMSGAGPIAVICPADRRKFGGR
jgi:hypothetical protein